MNMASRGITRALGLAALLSLAACGGGSDGSPSSPDNATGTVAGSVKDNTGAGVGSAQVQLSGTGKTTKNTTSGPDGSYTFSNVSAGVWQVSVIPPAGYSGGTFPTVTVVANNTATVGVITLTKATAGVTPVNDNVTIYQSAFSPQSVTIKAGGSVTWRNNDDIAHTATGGEFDTGLLLTGQSSTKTFATPGTYNYICSIHTNMTGKVVVVQ